MSFASPDALWLLALVPALLALVAREAKKRKERIGRLGDLELLGRLAEGLDEGRRARARLAGVVAFTLLVVALAGPRYGERTELLPQRGLDVVFAIDVSRSMRARDVLPDRLERTKAELSLLFDRLREHRIGIVAFAGTAFVQCPLTTDVEAARLFLGALDPDIVPQGGTDVGAGLMTAHNLFEAEAEAAPEARRAGRVLVVITDGEDHEGGVDEAAAALKADGVSVMVLGVGGRMGEPIPVVDDSGTVLGYKKDRRGETIMTRLSPDVLHDIAAKTGGAFLAAEEHADFGVAELEAAVGRLEKRELEARIKRTHVDRSAWPLGAALFFLVLSAALPLRRRVARRERVAPFVTALAVALTVSQANAEPPRALAREEPHLEQGRRALERGAPDDAIASFRAAPAEDPDERAVIEFDVGRALYEKGVAEAARAGEGAQPSPEEPAPGAQLFGEAASSFARAYGMARARDVRSQAALAEGNAHARAGDLKGAVDAYRRSLVVNPQNAPARNNLQTVLRALEAQPPPPSGGDGQEQEEEPEQGDQQESEQGDQQRDDESSAEQQRDAAEKEQQGEPQQEQQPQDASGEQQREQAQENQEQGAADEQQPTPGSPSEEKKDLSKERAKKMLDALRQRERPLNPHLMRADKNPRARPPERDW